MTSGEILGLGLHAAIVSKKVLVLLWLVFYDPPLELLDPLALEVGGLVFISLFVKFSMQLERYCF
jgi:hypothetical protein